MSLQSSSSHAEHINPKKLMIDFEPGYSLRDVLNTVFCHKWKIILFFCTVVSAISVSTYRMPYFYSSEAKIIINAGRDPNKIAPILVPSQHLNQNQQERVNNEVLILKSRILAEKVVNAIGYENFFKKRPPTPEQKTETTPQTNETKPEQKTEASVEQKSTDNPLKTSEQPSKKIEKPETPKEREIRIKNMTQAAINQVHGGLTVELKALSFIVGLTVTVRDAVLAQKILQVLLEEYLKHYIELNSPKSVGVFKKRYEELEIKLREKEEALYKFKTENNIVSLDGQIGMLISRVGELMGQIVGTESRVMGLRVKVADLETIVPNYDKLVISQTISGKTNNLLDALKNLLIKFQTQEIELTSRYPDDNRKVVEVKRQIELVEQMISNEPESLEESTESINQNYEYFARQLEDAKVELHLNETSLASMKESMANYQEKLDRLLSLELTLKRLEREQNMTLLEYQAQSEILQKADSYTALNEGKIVSIDIIEPPTFSDDAVKPNKPKSIVLAIILGLIGGIGLAFFLDYFDDSMKTNEDVKRHLKLPVLAMITTDEFERLYKS
jgi:uncharacterized protein involved in exopolysaccharide biosynthesis